MVTIITASGRAIAADAVIKSRIYQSSIYIYTNRLTDAEVQSIFGESTETAQLTVISPDTSEPAVKYTGYTQLFAVFPAELWAENPGEKLIWLQKPEVQ